MCSGHVSRHDDFQITSRLQRVVHLALPGTLSCSRIAMCTARTCKSMVSNHQILLLPRPQGTSECQLIPSPSCKLPIVLCAAQSQVTRRHRMHRSNGVELQPVPAVPELSGSYISYGFVNLFWQITWSNLTLCFFAGKCRGLYAAYAVSIPQFLRLRVNYKVKLSYAIT